MVLALASALPLLSALGCDTDASECSINMPVSGDLEGPIQIESTGENACGYEKISPGLILLSVFRSERPPGFNGVEGVDLVVTANGLAEGVFMTNVSMPDGTRTFTNADSPCTLTVISFERENWTVTDYLRFAALLECPDPLQMLGGSATVTLGSTQIQGYVLDDEG